MPFEGRERRDFLETGIFRGLGGDLADREMIKQSAQLAEKIEVPFKPREGLPVYSKECYMKNKESSGSAKPKSSVKEDSEDF